MEMTSVMDRDLKEIIAGIAPKAPFHQSSVVVTGAGGFLGFYILNTLARFSDDLGIERLLAVDRPDPLRTAWLQDLARTNPKLELRSVDVSDSHALSAAVSEEFTHFVHAASIASPTKYRASPIETIEANVWGTRNLLDCAMRAKDLRGFLFFSSSEVYGDPDPQQIPIKETYLGNVSTIGPRACYDESKRLGETLCSSYADVFGMPVTIVRPFNNFGPGMSIDDGRLPADLAKAVLNGEDIVLFSDGAPTRTFCYVSDAVAGFLKCLVFGEFGVFNIGNDYPEMSVHTFADTFAQQARELLNYAGRVTLRQSAESDYLVDNPKRRVPDISRARSVLGYAPTVSVEEGIRRYLHHLSEPL